MIYVVDIDVIVAALYDRDDEALNAIEKIAKRQDKPHCSPGLYLDYEDALRVAAGSSTGERSFNEMRKVLVAFGGHHSEPIDIDNRQIGKALMLDRQLAHVIATIWAADAEQVVTLRSGRLRNLLEVGKTEPVAPADFD